MRKQCQSTGNEALELTGDSPDVDLLLLNLPSRKVTNRLENKYIPQKSQKQKNADFFNPKVQL